MAMEGGEMSNVRVFRDVIKSSLGPNGLSKLLVNGQSGKILPSNANLFESFFATNSSPLPATTSSSNQHNTEGIHEKQSTTSTPTSTTRGISDTTTANPPPNVQRAQPTTTITTMVAALLKAQQYMMNSCKDGSTSVVLLAASFLEVGFKLHLEGISRNTISEIFQKGLLSSIAILDSMPTKKFTVDWSSLSQAQSALQIVLVSKLAPRESTSLSTLLAVAISTVASHSTKSSLDSSTMIDSIRLCPCVGGDVQMSSQITGIIIPYTPVSVQKSVSSKASIAIFAVSLEERHHKMNLVASLTSPEVLKQWQKEEEQILKAVAVGIIDAGANVVISSGLVHKYILHWLDMYGIVVVQSVPKADLIHISEATGARLIYQLPTTATTSTSTTTTAATAIVFDRLDFGMADSFETRSISGEDYSLVNVPRTVSLLIRGPTRHKTNQLVKCCRNALAVIREMKRTTSSSGSSAKLLGESEAHGDDRDHNHEVEVVVCAGGGVPEMTVAHLLPRMPILATGATSATGKVNYLEQYVLSAFAGGFEIIPKCLLENSGAPGDSFQLLKEQYERGRTSMGVTKMGNIEEFNMESERTTETTTATTATAAISAATSAAATTMVVAPPFDFVDVKRRVWTIAVDVASLLLIVNESVVGTPLQ